MNTISAPSTIRQFQRIPQINNSSCDYFTESGIRISNPIYVDIPNTTRKEILNAVREKCNEVVEQETQSVSGIRTTHSASAESTIESYLGLTMDNLRNVLFQRGGLQIDLVLKLQSVSGMELLSMKEIAAAHKAKQAAVKNVMENFTYESNDAG